MDIEAVWNFRVDLLEKIEKLRGSMAFIAFADHKSGSDVEDANSDVVPWRT